MLAYLHQSGDNARLSLKELTMKLAMLLALVLGSSFLRPCLSLSCGGPCLATGSLNPSDRSGETIDTRSCGPKFSDNRLFEADPYLCPVACFKEYVAQTMTLRAHNNPQLFVAMVKPHKPMLSCTIARWIKRILKDSGVDVSLFSLTPLEVQQTQQQQQLVSPLGAGRMVKSKYI